MSTADQHHRIDYIEFTVASIAASKAFYGGAFGWTFQEYGPDYCEFRDGRLTGYHWGLARKAAMLGTEAVRAQAAA